MEADHRAIISLLDNKVATLQIHILGTVSNKSLYVDQNSVSFETLLAK